MAVDVHALVAQYHAGLEAEMALLRQLEGHSSQLRQASVSGDYQALPAINEARDATMANLVAIEHDLKPLRQQMLDHRLHLQDLPAFHRVVEHHREAAQLVANISDADRESLAALKQSEDARREAAAAMEKGESTLAAYRRVIAPSLTNATLVNRRG